MQSSSRTVVVSAAVGTLCALAATLGVLAVTRQPFRLAGPPASSATSPFATGISTSGDAIVPRKPALALISVGVQSQQATATGAQQDLASKAGKLIARVKALGVPDKD